MAKQSLEKLNKLLTGPTLIFVAAVLWALDGIVRRSLFSLPPVTIVFYEHLIGSLILVPIVWPELKKLKLTKRVMGLTALIALLSGLLGTFWFTAALVKVSFISFSVVYLLQKLQPIFAAGSAHLLLKEKLTKTYLIWAALALLAAYFVTFPRGMVDFSAGNQNLIAALLAFGAAVAWGTSTTFSKMLLKETTDSVATALRFITTTIFGLMAVLVMGQAASLSAPDVSQFLRFALIAISTGMLALWIYYRGLQKTEAKVSTIIELTFPLLAIIIDTILYKTVLDVTQYLAAGVLLFAIYRVGKLNHP